MGGSTKVFNCQSFVLYGISLVASLSHPYACKVDNFCGNNFLLLKFQKNIFQAKFENIAMWCYGYYM